MTYLIIFIGSGIVSIVLLAVWTLRTEGELGLSEEPEVLHTIGKLRPAGRETVANIFAECDWKFISATAPDFRDAFLHERKRLALMWILQTRGRAARVMRLHRIAAREHSELQAGVELQLAAKYWKLWALCTALQVMIGARGPFKTRSMAQSVTESANIFWTAADQLLGTPAAQISQPDVRYMNS
jgi:hypothetical protein